MTYALCPVQLFTFSLSAGTLSKGELARLMTELIKQLASAEIRKHQSLLSHCLIPPFPSLPHTSCRCFQ